MHGRCSVVAELATGHGGNVELAADMIRAAADAGADLVKLQSYGPDKLNPRDPQANWLRQAHLDEAAHGRLLEVAQHVGVELFSTPSDAESLQMLRRLGLTRFKIASSESGNGWWHVQDGEKWVISWLWGRSQALAEWNHKTQYLYLTAIPLYPTPLECVGRAALLSGWSDHTIGIAACQWAIAQGAQMIEVHFTLPGRSRQMPWDKTPEQIRQVRQFAEDCATMRTGVAEQFRVRWSA